MKIMVLALVCFLAPALPARAQASDASGSWDLTVTSQQGSNSAVMTLKKNGEKLAGTINGPQGEVAVEGEQKDKAVSLWITVQTSNGALNLTLNGTQNGDSISGTMSIGGASQAEWTAKRTSPPPTPAGSSAQADKPIDVSGTWALEVVTDGGGGTPTFTFKQDGEKLTGQYKGQFGEAPVTGTIKGDSITVSVEISAEGQSVKATYAGTVEKDTMKGTVNFGDLAQGTFTGKKK